MDVFEANARKLAVRNAEENGLIADSMDVRRALMARVHSGEITLEVAQAELKRIQRGASKAGQMTRASAFRGA